MSGKLAAENVTNRAGSQPDRSILKRVAPEAPEDDFAKRARVAPPCVAVPKVVLASASPRRSQLLAQAGLSVEVRPAQGVDEARREGESPIQYTRRLAQTKAAAATAVLPASLRGDLVLAADTVVWFEPDLVSLGKPENRADAQAMLETLTTRTPHHVTTAYAILDAAGHFPMLTEHETTEVWMRRVPAGELEAYIEGGEWSDKAGGYAIQGGAASFVTRVVGSYTNVVGLPLAQVVARLHERGVTQ